MYVTDEEMEGPADADDGSTEQDSNDEEDAAMEDIDKEIDEGCNIFEVHSCMQLAHGCASVLHKTDSESIATQRIIL